MIEYIKGELTELTPAMAVVEAHGVGYAMNISLNTYSAIQGKKEVKLYAYEAIREDAHTLYGFVNKKERELFLLLITVSGVGPNTARMVLSSLSPSELCNSISTGNERMIKGVKGIGLKTAQRIIVDLKDKIGNLGIAAATATSSAIVAQNENGDEAIQALVALGYPLANANKAITQLLQKDPEMSVQALIKAGLRMM